MRAQVDRRLPSSRRGYSEAWRRAARLFRLQRPLCAPCLERGKATPAAEVHHITPLDKGGALLDPANLMPVCKSCHQALTQAEMAGRAARLGCGADGMPLDPSHPWRKAELA